MNPGTTFNSFFNFLVRWVIEYLIIGDKDYIFCEDCHGQKKHFSKDSIKKAPKSLKMK